MQSSPCCSPPPPAVQDKWVRLLTDVEPVIAAVVGLMPVFCLSLVGDGINVSLQALLRGAGKQKVGAGQQGSGPWLPGWRHLPLCCAVLRCADCVACCDQPSAVLCPSWASSSVSFRPGSDFAKLSLSSALVLSCPANPTDAVCSGAP